MTNPPDAPPGAAAGASAQATPTAPGVRVEFTVEPFVEGRPGPHVLAAWEAVELHGVQLLPGPFSSEALVGESSAPGVIADIVRAALSHGASHVAIQVERVGP